ncbi:LacI family DNA-binding transcriptional regulator [Actinopolymorpha sp. B9G3]|uniref:LacI family DNA-binding transcriptional regulator n=1 Tax=Actinopolymorpha sp. B9G3 TaxID=3158970 RepID=UPI0032D8C91A
MTPPAGGRRPTLTQVAARAGVSVMTASYTYSQPGRVSAEARSRVLAAAAELGYPGPDPSARSLRRGSTHTLGVILGEHLSYAFEDPQAASFLAGIADVCADRAYGMTILPITGAADDGQRIRAATVDGFILWTTSDDDPALTTVASLGRPAVVHGGPAVDGLGLVTIDNEAAAYAVGRVTFAGARRPLVMSFPLDRARVSSVVTGPDTAHVRFPVTRDRLAGFQRAAEEHGRPWRDVVVAVCAHNAADEAERLTARLLARADPPDAIAAMSDELAAGVVRAIRTTHGKVPDDVAVSGWDDAAIAADLGLTTVAQSLRDQGAQCARAVLGLEPPPPAAPWTVVVRESTRR